MAIQIEEKRGSGVIGMVLGLAIIGVAAYFAYKYFIEDSAQGASGGQGVVIQLPDNYTNAASTPWSGMDYDDFLDTVVTDLAKLQTDGAGTDPVSTDITVPSTITADFVDPLTNVRKPVQIPLYDDPSIELDEPIFVQVPAGRHPRTIAYM